MSFISKVIRKVLGRKRRDKRKHDASIYPMF